MESLICIHCLLPKTFEDMSKDSSDKRGHKGICKLCAAKKQAKFRVADPEKYRAVLRKCARKRLYGDAGIKHFDEQRQKQNGKCAICHQVMKKACSDHCHESGQWRGVLCDNCNRGLGLLKDDVEVLESAIAYLKFWVTR